MLFLATLALTVLASACSSLLTSDEPAAQTWWLDPPNLPGAGDGETRGPLVLRVSVAPGLNTDEIMSLDPEARFSPFSGANWADSLPELLDSLLTRGLATSGLFTRVGDWSTVDEPPCRLSLQAVSFHARLDGNRSAQSVEVSFEGRYRCQGDSMPVSASATQPVSGNRMPEVVAAFQRALDEAAKKLATQL
jgi:ABC-type uncharacterized transport system auxiliary subunit